MNTKLNNGNRPHESQTSLTSLTVQMLIAMNNDAIEFVVYDETDSIVFQGKDVPEYIGNTNVLYFEKVNDYVQVIIPNNYNGYNPNRHTLVIAGFPGTGKSYFFNNNTDYNVLDSDSSNFSWLEPGVRHPEFPNNYMQHIKENIGKVDIIFVSTHDVVRKALRDNNIEHYIVCPDISCKEEYINRYKQRGNDSKFIELMENKWDDFINGILVEYPGIQTLKQGETISTIIDKIIDGPSL